MKTSCTLLPQAPKSVQSNAKAAACPLGGGRAPKGRSHARPALGIQASGFRPCEDLLVLLWCESLLWKPRRGQYLLLCWQWTELASSGKHRSGISLRLACSCFSVAFIFSLPGLHLCVFSFGLLARSQDLPMSCLVLSRASTETSLAILSTENF